MDKFLGNWYVMQKIDSSSSCWTYNFSNKNNQSKVYQTRNQIVDVEDPEESKSYAGNLEVPDPNNPGVMTVRYPDNVAGKSQFVVYATDYTNYGAVFVCQRILFGHRLSASILSRQPYLDIYSTAKAREKLKGYGIDIRDFQKIDHKGCKYVPPQNRNANSSNVMKLMDF